LSGVETQENLLSVPRSGPWHRDEKRGETPELKEAWIRERDEIENRRERKR
jgi:hypothetical protein